MRRRYTKFIGGILLVAGTTIGAAMLALPVSTGLAGFIPSLALFVIFWVFMTYTALLFLEVNTWTGHNSNLITMAQKTLGTPGLILCWGGYLFLLYALMTAYIAGSGMILSDTLAKLTGTEPIGMAAATPLFAFFAYLLLKGTRHLDYLNRILMMGLVIAYTLMIVVLLPYVDVHLLERTEWRYAFAGVSIVATSFGFHIVIPSLYSYMNGDITWLKRTLIVGSAIPIVVYALWQSIALGIIPLEGPNGLAEGYREGVNGVHLLVPAISNNFFALFAELFSFFAIATSFIGVSLSLCDCLADGLKISRNFKGNFILMLLTFIPPFLIAITNPRAFLIALEYAGAFGVVLLLGLLPAMMVWSGRYFQNRTSEYQAPGGKWALIAAIIFSILIVVLEVAYQINI